MVFYEVSSAADSPIGALVTSKFGSVESVAGTSSPPPCAIPSLCSAAAVALYSSHVSVVVPSFDASAMTLSIVSIPSRSRLGISIAIGI